jgi:pilus assembly protein CpaD
MKIYPLPMLALAILALAACRPAATEWTENEAPKALRLDDAAVSVKVHFAPGSAQLSPADAARLKGMAAVGAITPADRVVVAAGGGPALAEARREVISAALLPYGIVTNPSPFAGVAANQAVVEVGRYVVTLPPCPNWSKAAGPDFTNSFASNFACANQTNLGQMVATPADLVSGQPLGFTSGPTAVTAVGHYLSDTVKPPVSSSSGGGGGGGGGSSGASSSPGS